MNLAVRNTEDKSVIYRFIAVESYSLEPRVSNPSWLTVNFKSGTFGGARSSVIVPDDRTKFEIEGNQYAI